MRGTERVWAELAPAALLYNVAQLRSRLSPGCRIIAVVKADAYGHGGIQTARLLSRFGVADFAVASCREGIDLRRGGVGGRVLVLCPTPPEEAELLARHRLTQALPSIEYAVSLNRRGIPLETELIVDTGMHRLGEDYREADRLHRMAALPHLTVTGTFTHLGQGGDPAVSREQLRRFASAVDTLRGRGVNPGRLHVQNSAGVWSLPGLSLDAVRVGMALYGVRDRLSEWEQPGGPRLRPVLSLKTRVIQVRRVEPGEPVGYGGGNAVASPRTAAVLSAGFADGVPRQLARGGLVLINGRRCPVIGVCMDMTIADVTAVSPPVRPGGVATFIGGDGEAFLPAEAMAEAAGTVTSDILCGLSSRVERRWLPLD